MVVPHHGANALSLPFERNRPHSTTTKNLLCSLRNSRSVDRVRVNLVVHPAKSLATTRNFAILGAPPVVVARPFPHLPGFGFRDHRPHQSQCFHVFRVKVFRASLIGINPTIYVGDCFYEALVIARPPDEAILVHHDHPANLDAVVGAPTGYCLQHGFKVGTYNVRLAGRAIVVLELVHYDHRVVRGVSPVVAALVVNSMPIAFVILADPRVAADRYQRPVKNRLHLLGG